MRPVSQPIRRLAWRLFSRVVVVFFKLSSLVSKILIHFSHLLGGFTPEQALSRGPECGAQRFRFLHACLRCLQETHRVLPCLQILRCVLEQFPRKGSRATMKFPDLFWKDLRGDTSSGSNAS